MGFGNGRKQHQSNGVGNGRGKKDQRKRHAGKYPVNAECFRSAEAAETKPERNKSGFGGLQKIQGNPLQSQRDRKMQKLPESGQKPGPK